MEGTSAAPDCNTQDRLPNTDTLEAGESFSLALNNKCDWQVSIPAGDCGATWLCGCATPPPPPRPSAACYGRPTALRRSILRSPSTLPGCSMRTTDGTDKAVGSVEFFNCYNPLALIDRTFTGRTHIANAMAGDKIDLAVTQVGSVAGCSTGGTYTLVLGEGVRIDLSDTTRTTLKQYLAVGPQLEAGDTLLSWLAAAPMPTPRCAATGSKPPPKALHDRHADDERAADFLPGLQLRGRCPVRSADAEERNGARHSGFGHRCAR